MGVMPCNRKMCPAILCRNYSEQYGYICEDCLSELKAADTTDIALFMATAKKDTRSIDEIFPRNDS